MKTLKPVPNFSFLLFILIVECMHFAMCLNMWTSLEQKQASNKTPVKRCVSPCRIFHSWCKNEGKCREKGRDCTWYCECPSDCEGFFCEKKVEKDAATEGGKSVEVNVSFEKEKKKPVSAFDKSKLAQALAGIFLKEKRTDEEKKTVLPDTIQRVGNTIKTKENVTAKVIINCPPGEIKPPSTEPPTKSTGVNVSNSQNHSNIDSNSVSRRKENTTPGDTHKVSTNKPKQPPVVTPSDVQSTTSTQSPVTPIVQSSFSVTSSPEKVTTAMYKQNTTAKSLESIINTQSQDYALETTVNTSTVKSNHLLSASLPKSTSVVPTEETTTVTSSTAPSTSSKIPVSQFSKVPTEAKSTSTGSVLTSTNLTKTINTKNSKDLTAPEENSLYIKKTDVIKVSEKPSLLDIIEKAIEVEFITATTSKQYSISPIKSTTENILDHISNDLTTENIQIKEKMTTNSYLSKNNLVTSTKIGNDKIPNVKSQSTTFQESTSVPASSSTISGKLTTTAKTNVIKMKKEIIETSTSVTPDVTNKQFNTKLTESLVTNQTNTEPNVSGNFHIQNVTNTPLTKQDSSSKSVSTTKGTKTVQITTAHETFKSTGDVLSQTNSKSTTPQVERPIHDTTTTHVIPTGSSTTRFKTKFNATTIKTTTQADTATKIPKSREFTTTEKVVPANSKSDIYLPKQQVTEDSTGINKSPRDTIVTGEINTLSSTNVPPVNLSQVITMSHDLPKSSKLDMSTVQTVMSNDTTTEQQISSKSSENVRESSTSPPTMKQNVQMSSSSTTTTTTTTTKITSMTEKSSPETSTASPTGTKSYQSTPSVNTQTTEELSMRKTKSESSPSINTQTTEKSSMSKTKIESTPSINTQTTKESSMRKTKTESTPSINTQTTKESSMRKTKTESTPSINTQTTEESSMRKSKTELTPSVNTQTTEESSIRKTKNESTPSINTQTTEESSMRKTKSESTPSINTQTTKESSMRKTKTESTPSINTQTTEESSMRKSKTELTPSVNTQTTEESSIRKTKNESTPSINTQTTEESSMRKTKTEIPYNDGTTSEKTTAGSKSNGNSESIKQTTPADDQTKKPKSNVELQISTSQNHETTTKQIHTQSASPLTTPEDKTLNTGTVSSATSLKVNTSNPTISEKSSTHSDIKVTTTAATPTRFKSTDSTSSNTPENVSSSVADGTVQKADKYNPSVESVTQTDVTTKAKLETNEQTTGSVIYSADMGESNMSLKKAFLDTKSDLFKKSKVKNDLLSNKISESVKDLKFDLLKMGLRDKGLPSDLDNIL